MVAYSYCPFQFSNSYFSHRKISLQLIHNPITYNFKVTNYLYIEVYLNIVVQNNYLIKIITERRVSINVIMFIAIDEDLELNLYSNELTKPIPYSFIFAQLATSISVHLFHIIKQIQKLISEDYHPHVLPSFPIGHFLSQWL